MVNGCHPLSIIVVIVIVLRLFIILSLRGSYSLSWLGSMTRLSKSVPICEASTKFWCISATKTPAHYEVFHFYDMFNHIVESMFLSYQPCVISDKDWTMARPLKDVTTERASEASPCQFRRTTAPQNKHLQTHSKSLMTHHISDVMTSWEYEQQKGFEEFKPRYLQCILEIFHLWTKKEGSQPTSVRLDWLMGLLRLKSPPFGFVVRHSNRFQHLQCDLKSGCCLWITLFVAHTHISSYYKNSILSSFSSNTWYTVTNIMIQYDTILYIDFSIS